MEKANKNITVLYCLAVMFTIWCTWNSVNTGGFTSQVMQYRTEVHLFQRQVASLIDIANEQEQRDNTVIVKDVLEKEIAPVEETPSE